MKKKMKKKCKICNTLFEFKIKDLIPIKNEINMFIVNCTYCYSEKRVFYNNNPKPEKILNDIIKPESKIISLNILQDCLDKQGLTKTSNLIKDFNNKYSKYITCNKRISRNEMISNLKAKQLEKQKHDLIDKITSESIVKQLIEPNLKYPNKNKYHIIIMIILFDILFCISIILGII